MIANQVISINELPIIGSLCVRKDFWEPRGKQYMAKGGFHVQKTILERDQGFFATVLL